MRLRELLGDQPAEPSLEGVEAFRRATTILDGGSVLLMPTDTVPGLVGSATSRRALERIAVLKGRSTTTPPPVLVGSIDEALAYAEPRRRSRLRALGALWPGPISAVVDAPTLADVVNPSGRSVALRVPDVEWLAELAAGRPLAASSANWHAVATPSDVDTALADLVAHGSPVAGRLAGVLWAPGPSGRVASTIVDLTGPRVRVLRQGAVAPSDVEAVLGEPVEVR